jgi:aspartyl-tRNA(Asn)/glutamyl-tRNA(Gln) amidotransferase subunit A
MTRTAMDAALMLQAIAGYDPNDVNSADTPLPDYAAGLEAKTSSLRVGLPRADFFSGLHPEIQAAIDTALSVLKKLAPTQREITIQTPTDAAFRVLIVEAYAYHREFVAKSPELYHPETLRRIHAGAEISGADYVAARRQLDQSRRSISKVFDAVDVVVTPTTPVPPFTISEFLTDPASLTKEILTAANTRPFNLLGLPTVSVPCGFTSTGLPIGMQITGPPGGETTVLRLAHAYQHATDWRRSKPNLV